MTYQQIIVVGNVGRAPELRYTPSGIAVTDFPLAVNRTWTNDAGEKQEHVTWWTVTCWRKTAETVAEYVKKGKPVMVIATQIEADAYTSRDGEARASLKIVADEVRFLPSGGGGNEQPRQPANANTGGRDDAPFDDTMNDIPF